MPPVCVRIAFPLIGQRATRHLHQKRSELLFFDSGQSISTGVIVTPGGRAAWRRWFPMRLRNNNWIQYSFEGASAALR